MKEIDSNINKHIRKIKPKCYVSAVRKQGDLSKYIRQITVLQTSDEYKTIGYLL